MVQIRLVRRGEKERVISFIRKEIYGDSSFTLIQEWISVRDDGDRYSQCFVAVEDDGEMVGTIIWGLYDVNGEEIALEIAFLAVDEDSWRQGIGRQLIESSFPMVRDSFADHRVAFVILKTEVSNEQARSFYRNVLGTNFCEEPDNLVELVIPGTWQDDGIVLFVARLP